MRDLQTVFNYIHLYINPVLADVFLKEKANKHWKIF